MKVVVNNEEETETEEMELEEWRSLLVSVLQEHTNAVLEALRNQHSEIVALFQTLPNQSLIERLLETNASQNEQISGSQRAMMDLLTLRLSPPEPIVIPAEPIPEPEPVVNVVDLPEVETPPAAKTEEEIRKERRQRI